MGQFRSFDEQVTNLRQWADKLKSGALRMDELDDLVACAREVYERSIILQYKAFEEKTGLNTVHAQAIDAIDTVEQEVEEFEAMPEEKSQQPSIEFALFDEEEEQEEVEPVAEENSGNEPEAEMEQNEPPLFLEEEQPVATLPEEKPETNPVASTVNPSSVERLLTRVKNDMTGQLGFTKLDSLIGSFGLNERLLYINELFDGSSDAFSVAIKQLDSRADLNDAKNTLTVFAHQYAWDLESETIGEFTLKICRRYA